MKRILSLASAAIMLLSVAPIQAHADGPDYTYSPYPYPRIWDSVVPDAVAYLDQSTPGMCDLDGANTLGYLEVSPYDDPIMDAYWTWSSGNTYNWTARRGGTFMMYIAKASDLATYGNIWECNWGWAEVTGNFTDGGVHIGDIEYADPEDTGSLPSPTDFAIIVACQSGQSDPIGTHSLATWLCFCAGDSGNCGRPYCYYEPHRNEVEYDSLEYDDDPYVGVNHPGYWWGQH